MQVLISKNEMTESSHRVQYVVLQNGQMVAGNLTATDKIFARSALKPMQALCLIESGASKAFDLDLKNIALACASHSGQFEHTSVVKDWLTKISVTPAQLACGIHRPYDEDTCDKIIEQKSGFNQTHNNCSGNHSNYLTVCRHQKWDVTNYHKGDHPVQKMVHHRISQYLNEDLKDFAIDGCSILAPRCSFTGLAKAYSQFLKDAESDSQSAPAMILKAFYQYPLLTSGKDEYCYQEMLKHPQKLMLKIGAEGVLLALVPHLKMVILLKVEDGSERATSPAMAYLLQKYAQFQDSASPRDIHNWAKEKVGEYRIKL